MPLEQIRELLAEDDPEFTAKRLAMHRERLTERLADQERMLLFLERLIERGGTFVDYDITTKQTADQHVAGLRTATTLAVIGEDIAAGFATLMGTLSRTGAEPVGAPFIIFHDVIDEQTDGDIEICIPIQAEVDASHDDLNDPKSVLPDDLLTEIQFPIDAAA